jgi:hypothetical protein
MQRLSAMPIRTTTVTTTGSPQLAAIRLSDPITPLPTCAWPKSLYAKNGWKLEFTAESFNLFNRVNRRFQLTQDGLMSNAAQFNFGTKHIGIKYFPASYQVPTTFMRATNAYAPRQLQFALRLGF